MCVCVCVCVCACTFVNFHHCQYFEMLVHVKTCWMLLMRQGRKEPHFQAPPSFPSLTVRKSGESLVSFLM